MKKKIAYGVTGLILGCIFLFPIYILIMNSFKTTRGFLQMCWDFRRKEHSHLKTIRMRFKNWIT